MSDRLLDFLDMGSPADVIAKSWPMPPLRELPMASDEISDAAAVAPLMMTRPAADSGGLLTPSANRAFGQIERSGLKR
jgi:hypothetical protein